MIIICAPTNTIDILNSFSLTDSLAVSSISSMLHLQLVFSHNLHNQELNNVLKVKSRIMRLNTSVVNTVNT